MTIHNTQDSGLFDNMRRSEAVRICKEVGGTLERTYRNYRWYVDVNMDGGVVNIFLPSLSTEFGMVIHIDKSLFDLEGAAIKFGGELLERFGLSRDINLEQAQDLKKDGRGNVLTAADGGI